MSAYKLLGAWLVLSICAFLSGCASGDSVEVRVTNLGSPDAPALEKVQVYSGLSKSSWPTLAGSESVSVLLQPGGDAPQVTLNYTLNQVPHSWRGPPISNGVGYIIAINIGADGTVSEQHCLRPCRLP